MARTCERDLSTTPASEVALRLVQIQLSTVRGQEGGAAVPSLEQVGSAAGHERPLTVQSFALGPTFKR